MMRSHVQRPTALLFDMDGTLTEPLLDFPRIKAEMGIGNRPILEALDDMDARERAAAEQVLHRHEEEAAARSKLNLGCRELLQWIDEAQIPIAIITRNGRLSAQTVFALHGLTIDCLITREDPPFKPSPAPLHLACERLDADATHAWMIGDGQYDIEAGLAAKMRTVWVSHGKARTFAAEPCHTVRDLPELAKMLQACCTPDDIVARVSNQ